MRRTRLTVAVLGASGYTGGELLRLLDGHPYVTITHVTADKSAGLPVTSLFPHLDTFHEFRFAPLDVEPILKKGPTSCFHACRIRKPWSRWQPASGPRNP